VVSRLDRYMVGEYLGPFIFGVGTFLVILLGVQLTPWMLRLWVRDDYPVGIVLRIFMYRLPGLLAMTFPMATVFGSLMCMSTLSASGEVIALRAGGLSFPRLSAAILVVALLTSVATLAFNEALVPSANDAAQRLIADYAPNARPLEYLTFSIPSEGQPQRVVYARRFDPAQKTLEGLTIMEMREGRVWQILSAGAASWRGTTWELRDVERTMVDEQNRQQTYRVARMTHEVGKSPRELARTEKDLVDMSMVELHRELDVRRRHSAPNSPAVLLAQQTIQLRWAIPWASLGFALIGVPLGLRPTRATTGIGLGLSLIIVFAYYVLFNTMTVVGQQGALPPVVAAWLPNFIVFGAGLGLFVNAAR
jgi:lipopolysaccharide export system permease protein